VPRLRDSKRGLILCRTFVDDYILRGNDGLILRRTFVDDCILSNGFN
jgi:hypothetical protein